MAVTINSESFFYLKKDFWPPPYTHRMFHKEHNLGEEVFEMIPLEREVPLFNNISNVCVDMTRCMVI